MNIEDILKRIKRTRGNLDEPLENYICTCLSLSKEEFDEIDDSIGISDFCFDNHITFATIKYDGTIEFIHLSNPDNEDSIKQKGLIDIYPNWVSDLGKGIHVIKKNDFVGEDNLMTHFGTMQKDEELLKITGTYTGIYEQCVYGEKEEGSVIINQNIKPEDLNIEVVTFRDFFY